MAPSPDPRTLRVALVGAGYIADFHLEILRSVPGLELAAVCDADLERARAAARRHGVPQAVASLDELAQLGVDLAHVLVPPDAHVAVTRALLERGIGALVEKPLALSAEDCRELGRLAAARGLALGVNHNAVHHPGFARLLERVRAGEIGRVEHVRVTWSVPLRQLDAGDLSHWMFRQPRNIVFEQALHPFTLACELVGAPREVRSTLLRTRELAPGRPFHERWLIAGDAERGTLELYLHCGATFQRSVLEVLGSDGSLEVDLHHDLVAGERKTVWLDFWNSFLAGWRRGGELRRSARRVLLQYLRQTLGLGARQDAFFAGMRGSILAFYAALRAGQPVPAGAEQAARALTWCEAATREVLERPLAPLEIPAPGPARPGEVVVLGATGFIGRRVVERLLERGVAVTAVVRRAHSLPPSLVEGFRSGRVRLVHARLEEPDTLGEALRGARCVLQLATGGGASWEAIERGMVRGTSAVAQAALDAGVQRFVYVSSLAALYLGRDRGAPAGDELEPDPQPGKRALYARGKIAAERALLALQRERGLPLTIVRPGVVLGAGSPMQHSGLGLWVRDNHCVGWGRGDTPLPLVWVDDVAQALVLVALHEGDELLGRALDLAAAPGLTAAEVVEALRRASGRDLHFHPRRLALSQALEIGKWIVKRVGGRRDAPFPPWRDLKSRALAAPVPARAARELLGWTPVEARARFLELAVLPMAQPTPVERR